MRAATEEGRLVNELTARREEFVERLVESARGMGDNDQLDASYEAEFRRNVSGGFDAVVLAMAERRSFTPADVTFLAPYLSTRAAEGVTEAEMMATVRLFQRTLWDLITELAGDEPERHSAALVLSGPLNSYIEVLSQIANEAFAEAHDAMKSRASALQGELVEDLLAGRRPAPGVLLDTARECGLEQQAPLVVVVAQVVSAATDDTVLSAVARALARVDVKIGGALALRSRQTILIQPMSASEAPRFAELLDGVRARFEAGGAALAIGSSTVHESLDEAPDAYQEACVALEYVREVGGVLALTRLDPLEYVLMRVGDRTAWRLLPEPVRDFVEEDLGKGGSLSATLLAYVDCDLNIRRAAERLFVHPNTAHYRLSKIEERTGCSVRRFVDLQTLVIAIRLAGAR